MPLSIDKERQQLDAEEAKLVDRRKRLEERERDELLGAVEKAGLLKVPARGRAILDRIKKLGLVEVERRLASEPSS